MNRVGQANQHIDLIRVKTGEAILFCSLGKDSLVLLDLLYPKFKRLVCVFMYFVPDLDHVNRYVNWVKSRYPRIEFVQAPHWNLTHILRSGMYCIPNPDIKLLSLADIIYSMRLTYGIEYVFLGMKKADSMNRRMMLNDIDAKSGVYESKGMVYPLADWTQKDILAYMRQKRLPEPVRYSKKASGGIGFNLDCFLWLRENCPQDLQKIIKAFPMSERILWEHDNKKDMEVHCNECGKALFSTKLTSEGAIGCEAQEKGFVFKMACLYSDKYNCLYFCNHECGKAFYQRNIPKNEEVTEAINEAKAKIPQMSSDVARKMAQLTKNLKNGTK